MNKSGKRMKNQIGRKMIIYCLLTTLLLPLFVGHVNATELYVDRKADVVFVIDATGSMGGCISSVKSNITDFINLISKEDVDICVKFVIYRDITCSEPTQASSWYSATDASASYLTDVQATGGGDGPETLLDGLGMMLSGGFRSDAVKYCICFTDAETKIDNKYGYGTEEEAIAAVNSAGINTSVVTGNTLFENYAKYVSSDKGGILADINGDYSILLKGLADTIVDEIDSLSGLSMSPRNCKEGEDVTVRVTSSDEAGITYASDFSVLFDGEVAEVVSKESSYFEFKVPTSKILGKYEVKVVNGGATSMVGHFTIESAADYGAMTPNSTTKGTAVTVRVPVSKMNYARDFAVRVGGTKVTVSSKDAEYFTFDVPSTLDVKSYDVTVTNGGQNKYLGEFQVSARTPVIGAMTPVESYEGVETIVKVMSDDLDYDSDFKVFMNGEEVVVTKKLADYFKFTVPGDQEAGTYLITFINSSKNYSVGTYTIKGEEPIVPVIGAMSQTANDQGVETIVQVPVTNLEYADDFSVKMQDVAVPVTKKLSGYFKFVVPAAMPVGTYEVSVVNNGITYVLGNYTINGVAPIIPSFTIIEPNTNEKGAETTVKVSVKKLEYADDFTVCLNDKNMTVSKKLADYFKFIVPADFSAGTYTINVTNSGNSYTIGTYEVTEASATMENPSFGAMSISSEEEGSAVTVQVPITNLEYADDFAVTTGARALNVSKKLAEYFKFEIPSDMLAGDYLITVINNGTSYNIGTFKVTSKPVAMPTFGAMSISSAEEGSAVTVQVPITNLEYADDFAVTTGARALNVSKKLAEYFKFEIPSDMLAGDYPITITNNGTNYNIGTFKVTTKPVVMPTFGGLSPASSNAGVATTVKVTKTNLEYSNDFAVALNGENVNVTKKLAGYFKFVVPASMTAGVYDVTVTNNGRNYNIGTYTIN